MEGYEALVAGLTLPDPDDRHVLAAAIRCGASVIVTFNERDFPNDLLAPYGIESQHPDEFVDNLLDLDAAAVVSAAQRQRAQLKHPPIEVDRYLEILLRQGLVQTTKVLATYHTILLTRREPRMTKNPSSDATLPKGIHQLEAAGHVAGRPVGFHRHGRSSQEAVAVTGDRQLHGAPQVERTVLPCTA